VVAVSLSLEKKMKRMVKARLTDLITGAAVSSAATKKTEEEEGVGGGNRTTKKTKINEKKVKRDKVTGRKNDDYATGGASDDEGNHYHEDDESVDDADALGGNDSSSDYDDETATNASTRKKRSEGKKTKKNSSRGNKSWGKKGGRMAEHMRERHARARARQVEEARIRREELGHLADDDVDDGLVANKEAKANVRENEEVDNDAGEPRISEEDRDRAKAIASRFDTNREELRVRRIEDREELIERLRTKRLEIIASSGDEDVRSVVTLGDGSTTKASAVGTTTKEENESMSRLKSSNVMMEDEGNDPAIDVPAVAKREDYNSNNDDDSDDDDEDDEEATSDDDDELEIIAPSSPWKLPTNATSDKLKTSTVDLLFQRSSGNSKAAARKDPKKTSRPAANPRAALKNALRVKVLNEGNRWLAR
jgi:hypothetical protein